MADLVCNLQSDQAIKELGKVRPFEAKDREAVRNICADTGFLGKPIDPVFQDRELFADFLCNYYTDVEPESSLVLEKEDEVVGYLLGSRFPKKQHSYDLSRFPLLLPKLAWRYCFYYSQDSRNYLNWLIANGRKETPHTPESTPHLHINILPEFKRLAVVKDMMNPYLAYLAENGEKAVFGQMVTYNNRRGAEMFKRYGFDVIDIKEVTKYRKFTDQKIFLSTVYKDLTLNSNVDGKI